MPPGGRLPPTKMRLGLIVAGLGVAAAAGLLVVALRPPPTDIGVRSQCDSSLPPPDIQGQGGLAEQAESPRSSTRLSAPATGATIDRGPAAGSMPQTLPVVEAASLERRLAAIEQTLARLEEGMAGLHATMARLRDRIDPPPPTWEEIVSALRDEAGGHIAMGEAGVQNMADPTRSPSLEGADRAAMVENYRRKLAHGQELLAALDRVRTEADFAAFESQWSYQVETMRERLMDTKRGR